MNEERLALEEFLIDNEDLENLELLLDEFNIFEALGAVNVELRHSEFLAFLMNPNQSHGLGDVFVKRFLQKAVAGVDPGDLPFTAIDLDIWNLDDLEVRREWSNIDILLLAEISENDKLAVIIENKVGSGEHSKQLQRYYQIVEQQFPGWKILGLFLTPEGDEPSDDRYLPVSYETVCTLIESIRTSRKSSLGPDIHTLMTHYTAMLRRHILSESEIQELCQKIYRKHQRALDMIFDYRPDLQSEVKAKLLQMVQSTPKMTLDHTGKTKIRFIPNALDSSMLKQGQGWSSQGRMLLFEFQNSVDRLSLSLIIGPGPNEIRVKLSEMAREGNPPLKHFRAMGKKYQTIYRQFFISTADYEKLDSEELFAKIAAKWEKFLNGDLPKIERILKAQPWLWEDAKPEE